MRRLLSPYLFGPVLFFAAWLANPLLAVSADGHEEGVPLALKEDLAVWSLVAFVIFVLVLRKFAWGPLSTGLNRRESRVRQDIAAAESARIKAEQMLAEHQGRLEAVQEEVREIIAEARRDAEHTKNDIIATAQREAEVSKQRALNEIERARQQALKDIFDQVSETVMEATEHVLGRSVTDADQDRLINEALAEVSR
jgi:F-type H+-transporting ATPase subunit b